MSAISSKSEKLIDAQTKVKLNIHQLILAKIAQLRRYEAVNTKSEHYSPTVTGSIPVSFLLNLFCSNNSGIETRMVYFRENSIVLLWNRFRESDKSLKYELYTI